MFYTYMALEDLLPELVENDMDETELKINNLKKERLEHIFWGSLSTIFISFSSYYHISQQSISSELTLQQEIFRYVSLGCLPLAALGIVASAVCIYKNSKEIKKAEISESYNILG